jgi:ubiquinone biosynthesis monooxygenase Coq7
MRERNLTPVDRLLAGANNALRTIAAPAGRPARKNPAADITEADLTDKQRAHAAGLMRVNHAGEVAAQALYQGHATVARDPDIEEQMQRAAEEEFDHLAWCEQRLSELNQRPSVLSPVWYTGAFLIGAAWYTGAFLIGAASGVLGDKWSLGFIAETEKQVCAHLDSHLDRLPDDDARSRAIVAQMRDEEEEHGENAKDAGAAELPEPVRELMKLTARVMTSTAYRV